MNSGERRTADAGGKAGARAALVAAALFLAAAALPAAPLAGAGPSPAPNPAPGGPPGVAERLTVRATGDLLIPILGDESFFGLGNRAGAALEYRLFDFLSLSARAGTGSVAIGGLAPLALGDAGLGLALELRPLPRWLLRLEGSGGVFNAKWGSLPASGLGLSARGEFGFRLSPALTLSLGGGYSWYGGPGGALLNAANAGLVLTVRPSALGSSATRVLVETAALEPVFPVFHGYYDENPFGSLRVTNGEEGEITDLRVSFVSSRYMARPKELGGAAKLAPGASVEVPLRALFSEEVLAATETSLLPSEAIVEYRLVGSKREVRHPIDLRMYHRNAMNWDDDRRAAAFVSPKDPAVLWFARFGQGIARDRLRGGVDPNLQYAASLFESLRLFGVNYVVDPSSSYVEKSASGSSVDYLQYPYQTLAYRGGDCDDLSILFCSLLSSLGVETAFITIPGHIYMAFALSLGEEEARDAFYDQGLVIREGGKVWLPVEITMVKDGFAKAWRVGAKEWADNARQGQAKLYPLAEAWRLYPSVGIPDVNPRFSLPDPAMAMQAFDMAMDRYIAREIEQRVKTLVAGAAPGPGRDNELGILYGRAGMLKESWRELSKAAKEGFEPAWVNLGNVAFIRKDYELSLTYYEWARKLEPADALAALGLARSYYELERFDASDREYERLRALDPGLAAKFGYLASTYGGEGRAWSLADRLSSTRWAIPKPAPAVVKAPVPAPMPAAPAAQAAPSAAAPVASVEAAPGYSAPPSPSQEGFMGVAAAGPSVAAVVPPTGPDPMPSVEAVVAAPASEGESGAPTIADEPEQATVAQAADPAAPEVAVAPAPASGFSLLLNPPQGPDASASAAAPTIAEALPEDRELEEQRAAAAREVEAAAIAKLANEAAAARAEAEAAALREAEMAARAKLKAEADAEAARLAQEAERRAAEAERLAAAKRAADAARAAAEKLAADKLAAETAEAERLAAEKLAAERTAAETAELEAPAAPETATQADAAVAAAAE
ncbi:MAG: hypothetical protein JNG85_06180, partial [Spirochaetaceae bacterium]|nr:hypothetical protein [Spirochaetaceae bacterium]